MTRSASRLLRSHALFLAALLVATVVRVVVMVAYRPALIFTDSFSYLNAADHLVLSVFRPSGYSLLMALTRAFTDSTTPLVLLQHAAGLGLAVACYVFLLRRGLPAWGATLATLPLLLDPLQLVLEHYILSDVLFEVMLVGACLVLLWRHEPGPVAMAFAGLLVAGAGLVRGAGSFLVVVFLAAVLCLRLPWGRVVIFLLTVAVPITVYAAVFHHQHDRWALATMGPRFLYARLAPITPCKNLDLSPDQRQLCPPEPPAERPDTNEYMWDQGRGVQWHLRLSEGGTPLEVIKGFDKVVVREQPVIYTRAVLTDFVRGFAPLRTYDVPGYPSSYWLFQDHYWTVDHFPGARKKLDDGVFEPPIAEHPASAELMTGYRYVVFTPGPLMAALLLLAVAAIVGLGRSRWSRNRVAMGLLVGACLVPLLTGAALSGFSWRYQLPQIALLPMAGALALAALVRGPAPGAPAPAPPLRLLDRGAERVARAPVGHAGRRALLRAGERGVLQIGLALVAGAAAAAVVMAAALASGWCKPSTAAVFGLLAGGLAVVVLLVSRWRQGPPRGR